MAHSYKELVNVRRYMRQRVTNITNLLARDADSMSQNELIDSKNQLRALADELHETNVQINACNS